MQMRQPRYSKEEHARRGNEIYTQHVRPQVEASNQGKIVAIDVETGAFEIAERYAGRCATASLPPSRTPRFGVSGSATPGSIVLAAPLWEQVRPMITGMVNANREAIIQLVTLGPPGTSTGRLRRSLIPALPVF